MITKIQQDNKEDSIELLRIICMIWIISRHICGFVSMDYLMGKNVSLNYLVDLFCFIGGDIANNIFFLIMGYNLIEKNFKIKRILKIWYKCFFYSVLSWMILFAFNNEMFTLENIFAMLLPIANNTWWFASTYIVILLIAPIINKLVYESDKKDVYKYVVIMLLIFAAFSIFLSWLRDSNYIYISAIVYMIGGMIKKYKIRAKVNCIHICACLGG